MTCRLGILTTHPIQYQVPWFRALAHGPGIDLQVLFCMVPDARQQGAGFGVDFHWDVPLLDGYSYEVLRNTARQPAVTTFAGCDTPEVGVQIRRHRFDAVIVNGWVVKSCLQALFACRRQGVPCLVRGESNTLRPRTWWRRLAHRVLLRQYAACLSIGRANHEFYRRNGVPDSRIFATPYGVDNDWFGARADEIRGQRQQLRDRWGVPPDAIVFLFCGKFVAKKRPMDLLEAAVRARRRNPFAAEHIHLLFAGDGELRAVCESFAREHDLRASYAGFLNQREVVRAYVAADCLVLPSDSGETWGLVVNEAFACGLPAVVSDQVGCHADLVRPADTGLVFSCGDCDALAQSLVSLSEQPRMLADMGQQARAHVCAGFGVRQVVDGVLAGLRYVRKLAPPAGG